MDVAHHQGNGALSAALRLALARQAVSLFGGDAVEQVLKIAFKTVDPERSPTGGEIGLGYLLDCLRSGTIHTWIISCGAHPAMFRRPKRGKRTGQKSGDAT